MQVRTHKKRYILSHACRRNAWVGVRRAGNGERGSRDIRWEGSLKIYSPTFHLEHTSTRTTHSLGLLTGWFLFCCYVIQLLTAYEVCWSVCMANSREKNKTFHLQALAPHLDKCKQQKWTVGQHWGGISSLSVPNHQRKGSCGPEKMKSAIPRRRWKGTSQAGALLMAPPGLCKSPFSCTHKRIQASHLKSASGQSLLLDQVCPVKTVNEVMHETAFYLRAFHS